MDDRDFLLALSVLCFVMAATVITLRALRWYGATFPCKGKRRIIALAMKVGNNCFVQGVHMSTVVRSDEIVTFQPVFEDAFGNVADQLGSAPVWSVSDESIGSLEVSEDGLVAVFTPTGKKGTTQIALLVDSDPGVDEEVLAGTAELTVLSGKATVVKLTGVLSDRPAATEAPVATEAPAETPAPTEAPVATEAPVDQQPTDAPEETEAPAEPQPTGAPEAPAETEAPAATEAP